MAVRRSDRGGERAAMMYSLIVTCKLNDVDPQAWLTDVLARIAEHPTASSKSCCRAMEGYEHVQRVRSRGLRQRTLATKRSAEYPSKRQAETTPSRLSNPSMCEPQQVLRERTGGCSPDEY